METWKDIEGYAGLYQVSDAGRIKSLSRIINGTLGGSYLTKQRVLNPPIYSRGYRMVKLYNDGKCQRVGVHVLVARAFIDNPSDKPMVNHKDGNKSNNDVCNLEWVTSHENHLHAAATGLKAKGDRHGFSRLNSKAVAVIKGMLQDHISQRVIAQRFKFCQATIKDINLKKTWREIEAEPEYKHLLQ
jgi:hypothetical protein